MKIIYLGLLLIITTFCITSDTSIIETVSEPIEEPVSLQTEALMVNDWDYNKAIEWLRNRTLDCFANYMIWK